MGLNMENFLSYSPAAYDLVLHVLVLGFGAHVAGLVYFLTTSSRSAPKYRLASTISGVVMVSAALILFQQQQNWSNAFVFNGDRWVRTDDTFSNGYRYINWTIDVPMLLTQLLIVLGIVGASFKKLWWRLTVASLGMIYTGYVGQFYEATSVTQVLVWGTISTVFFVYLLYVVWTTIDKQLGTMSPRAAGWIRAARWVLVVSWLLYPGAYLAPLAGLTEQVVVARQMTITIADITSKIIFGVLLSLAAEARSSDEGFQQARTAQGEREGDLVAEQA